MFSDALDPILQPPSQAFARLVLVGACLLQGLVFLLDLVTPLGFAHGLLYAPPVLLGLLAQRFWVIWLLVALGLLGTVMGWSLVQERLPGVEDLYILLNRGLGLLSVLLAGVAADGLLRLLQRLRVSERQLARTGGLLEVASSVGRLGGWRVELPARDSHWTREVFRLLGQPLGPVPDIDAIIRCYAPEYQARVLAAFEACVGEGRGFDLEVQVQTDDGARRWVRVVGEAVRDETGRILRAQGAIQDIDEHHAARDELERSRAKWRLMAESLPMMLWISPSDGTITYANHYAANYLGIEPKQLLGEAWLEHIHPEDRGVLLRSWRSAIACGDDFEGEFRVRRRDGAWRWHLARAARVAMVGGGWRWYGTAMDVQDLRDAQEARARLADQLSETMESVTDAIFILDRNWRVSFLNRQAEVLLERGRSELLGRNVWDEFPQARGSIFQQNYERCAREGVTVRFDAEYGPLGKHFEVNAYPHDAGVVVYFRDVTEARRMAAQVDQSQRMESLGQLTGGVAHDFNNLLTVILGNAEVLAEQQSEGSSPRLMLEMITTAAARGAEMTQRLLAFARRQALQPRPIDLNRQVGQFAPLLRRALGEQVDVEMVQAGGLWQTQVDPGQLEAALLNLAVNARDAMPDGGRLTIETANTRLDENYVRKHPGLECGQYVLLAVSDTGEGIAPAHLPRVFEPFFTTKQVGHGTGLGLAMVYGFVKQSRGHVAIYSEQGKGTTVKIYLPRLLSGDASALPDEPADAGPSGAGQLVLLVEDDDLVREYACGQLLALGYRVIEAANGPQAIARLQATPGVDLLFTDVVMPGGMSGRPLAEAARALRPELPVLFTSGYTENAIVHHGRLDPGVLLLSKPYRRAQLAEKLRQALSAGGQLV